MNKGKLIELINAALSVTGDVHFDDTGTTLLTMAKNGDLNKPAICLLMIETNALSEVVFEKYCLPFLVMKKGQDKQILLSDFDGEVNFEKKSNAVALMLMVRAIENIFDHKPGVKPKPLKEKDIDAKFQQYAQGFASGEIVSALSRAQEIKVDLIQSVINDMTKVLVSEYNKENLADETFDFGAFDLSTEEADTPTTTQVSNTPGSEGKKETSENGKSDDTPGVDPFKM